MSAENVPQAAGEASGPSAPDVSRRTMLGVGMGVAGLTAGALLGASPAMAAASGVTARQRRGTDGAGGAAAPDTAAVSGEVVVHVRDVRSGDMEIFAGTGEARLRDPDLAARLVRAMGAR